LIQLFIINHQFQDKFAIKIAAAQSQ